jgi:hypothetical protein
LFAAPTEKKWIHFRDPDATVSVFPQQTGYIKTMSAFCSHNCTITYDIENGKLILQTENGCLLVCRAKLSSRSLPMFQEGGKWLLNINKLLPDCMEQNSNPEDGHVYT